MRKTINIEGMNCPHCVSAVTKALSSLECISNIRVSLENKQATLDVTASVTDTMLRDAIDDQGYDVKSIL
ncbi:Copper chaperone CopZ [anaerobic digester metagenome]